LVLLHLRLFLKQKKQKLKQKKRLKLVHYFKINHSLTFSNQKNKEANSYKCNGEQDFFQCHLKVVWEVLEHSHHCHNILKHKVFHLKIEDHKEWCNKIEDSHKLCPHSLVEVNSHLWWDSHNKIWWEEEWEDPLSTINSREGQINSKEISKIDNKEDNKIEDNSNRAIEDKISKIEIKECSKEDHKDNINKEEEVNKIEVHKIKTLTNHLLNK